MSCRSQDIALDSLKVNLAEAGTQTDRAAGLDNRQIAQSPLHGEIVIAIRDPADAIAAQGVRRQGFTRCQSKQKVSWFGASKVEGFDGARLQAEGLKRRLAIGIDRKSTRLNSSHLVI